MPSTRLRRSVLATLVFATVAVTPAAASAAATVSVTGDTGTAIPVPAGAPPTIRNMRPDVTVAYPPGDGRSIVTVTGPTGTSATSDSGCYSHGIGGPYTVNYAGNGAYTVTVTNFGTDDSACAAPISTESYPFTIAAGTAITPPPGAFLYRRPGSFDTGALTLQLATNPNAGSLDVLYSQNPKLNADGSIAGNPFKATGDITTGQVQLRPNGPGIYYVVARASRFAAAGNFGSPWTAPLKVVVAGPFDASRYLDTTDTRGPSYKVVLRLREKSARGTVSVSIARGTKGGKYRSLGHAHLSSTGTASKRFTATRTGSYRLKFTYKGSATILPGSLVYGFKVTRRYF